MGLRIDPPRLPFFVRRLLFNLVCLTSLIICFAICAMWARSFYWTDQKTWLTPTAFYEVMSGEGGVVLYRLRPNDGEVRWMRPTMTSNILGVEAIEGRLARRRPWKMIILPYWLPAGVTAILPGLWIFARAARERRARVRRCPVCGTELSAAASTAPCSSCGWVASPVSVPAPLPAGASAAPPALPPATALNPKPVAYRPRT